MIARFNVYDLWSDLILACLLSVGSPWLVVHLIISSNLCSHDPMIIEHKLCRSSSIVLHLRIKMKFLESESEGNILYNLPNNNLPTDKDCFTFFVQYFPLIFFMWYEMQKFVDGLLCWLLGRNMMVNRFDTEFVRHVSEVFSCSELRVESFLFYNQTVRWWKVLWIESNLLKNLRCCK